MPNEFKPIRVMLRSEEQRHYVLHAISKLPTSDTSPLEIIIQEPAPMRGMDQNALMWAGPLKDFSEHWVTDEHGTKRQYTAVVWHEYLKKEFLPEDDDPDIAILVKANYHKWAFDPSGAKVLTGSTTQLTKKYGFPWYLEKVYAYGASLGIHFHSPANHDLR